jgi:CheY-like chemotaxis protein
MQKRKTILVSDDNPDDTALLKRVFKMARVLNPLQCVPDGDKVIAYLTGKGKYANREAFPYPVLLLLDLRMPGKSGLDDLAWLQKQPPSEAVSVVVLTEVSETRIIKQAYELGADSFLVKPLIVEDLINLICRLRTIRLESSEEGHYVELIEPGTTGRLPEEALRDREWWNE